MVGHLSTPTILRRFSVHGTFSGGCLLLTTHRVTGEQKLLSGVRKRILLGNTNPGTSERESDAAARALLSHTNTQTEDTPTPTPTGKQLGLLAIGDRAQVQNQVGNHPNKW